MSWPEYLLCVRCPQKEVNDCSFSSLRPTLRANESIRHKSQSWKDLTPEGCCHGLTQLPAERQGSPELPALWAWVVPEMEG